ncbi:hypothetical protein ACFVYV_53125 [Streptomyces mirabilis]|uniref:hypothetical protein n=1 Tax=Streptomyces mirabilis TaxID=68239 RepID=UPI0036DD6B43
MEYPPGPRAWPSPPDHGWTAALDGNPADARMGGDADEIVGPATGHHLIEDTQLTGDTCYGGAGHYCYYLIPTG